MKSESSKALMTSGSSRGFLAGSACYSRRRSWPRAPATEAQSVGGAAGRVAAATASRRATSRSYNRLATTSQGTSAAPMRAATRSGGGYVANAMTPQDDPLHPYTNQTRQALARGSNSEIPAGSSWQPGSRRPEPEPEPVPDRPVRVTTIPPCGSDSTPMPTWRRSLVPAPACLISVSPTGAMRWPAWAAADSPEARVGPALTSWPDRNTGLFGDRLLL